MIKNKIKFLRLICIIILIPLIITGCNILLDYNDSTSEKKEEISITVPQGSGTSAIAEILKSNDLIKNKISFKLKVKNMGYDGKLNYGTFNLDKGMCMEDIVEIMATTVAEKEGITVTIPEGYSVEMIAKKIAEANICEENEFLNALNENYNFEFIKNIPEKEYNYKLQGFLFPNTYQFDIDAEPEKIIEKMLGEFEKQYEEITGKKNEENIFEIVNFASVIERESKLDSERNKIAGVIVNRLNKDMLLQVDATVIYPISKGLYDLDRVLFRDLEVDSLYNTYKYSGLPVGPICNPGREAIEAALNPEEHNYLYYHTDEEKQDGSHIFTETFEEHTATMN